MIPLAWVLSLAGAFFLGYHYRRLNNKVQELEIEVKKKITKPEEIEPKSVLIDPLDPIKEAMWQAEQLNKRLNPDEE